MDEPEPAEPGAIRGESNPQAGADAVVDDNGAAENPDDAVAAPDGTVDPDGHEPPLHAASAMTEAGPTAFCMAPFDVAP